MSCRQHDDDPFPADDPFLPSYDQSGGALRSSLVLTAWVLLFVACGVAVAVAVMG